MLLVEDLLALLVQAVASLAINPAGMSSVGASGAIMGLLVAAFVSSFRLGTWTRARTRIQARSIQLLVPSLLPLATTAAGGHIDYAAHLGGAVACAVPALLLLKTWPEMAPLPRFRQAAAGVALAGLLLVSLSAAAAASHFSAYASVASRIPVEFHRLSPDIAKPPEFADVDPQLLTNCPFVKGDSVERVKEYYGIASDPRKLENLTPAGTAFQYHFEQYGVWVFFDNQLLVKSVRLDSPFGGVIQRVAIGDRMDRVRSVKGPAVSQFQGFPVLIGGGPVDHTTAWVYGPDTPSFVRYDFLNGKVRSILANSCAPGT